MPDGLEIVIDYRGVKHDQVVSKSASLSAAFAILKRDLAHLRVHSPSQRNVRLVNGSFVLHWPTAGLSTKAAGNDSLHTRWYKLCSDDPESHRLRDFLSIESIVMTQDGRLICSTTPSQKDVLKAPLAMRLSDSLPSLPVSLPCPPAPPFLPAKPPPPSAPRVDRLPPPTLKRRLSEDGSSNPPAVRPKLGPTTSTTTLPPRPMNSLGAGLQHVPGEAPRAFSSLPVPNAGLARAAEAPSGTWSTQASGERTNPPAMSTLTPVTIPGPSNVGPSSTTARLPPPRIPRPPPPPPPLQVPPPSRLPSHSHSRSPGPGSDSESARRRQHDVTELTRELWNTRRQRTALQAREQQILADLERLDARPEPEPDAEGNNGLRAELMQLEAELGTERARRTRVEQLLSDVERECREPFVVPALFHAFIRISELTP